MTELTLAGAIAELIKSYGMVGVVAIFMVFLVWQDKRRCQKEDADRLERKANADADRLLLTNHLSALIKGDTSSRIELAASLATLAQSINNFQTRCGQIQDDLQNEVDRLKKG